MTDNNMNLNNTPEKELDLEQLEQVSGGADTAKTILLMKLIEVTVDSRLEALAGTTCAVTESDFQSVLENILNRYTKQLGGYKGTGKTKAEVETIAREKWEAKRRELGI
jgi:hypothetical protein